MAVSIVEICNNALLDLGEETIISLTDNCKAAKLCAHRWPAVRDLVLRAHPWNCAMAMTSLPALASTPAWRWDYQYQLPADCLRVIAVADSSENTVLEYEVLGRMILCDTTSPIYLLYVKRETDPVKYDALLSEALSARMSMSLALPLTASTSAVEAFGALYQAKIAEARGVDAREGMPEEMVISNWIAAKLGG